MLEVANRLRINKDQPLSSRDLIILKTGTEDYLEIREELYVIAGAYECGTEVTDETLAKYNIDSQLRLKGIMLSLGAALTLHDNYLLGTSLFEQDSRLRKIINDPDMGFGVIANKLSEMTLAANSIENRHRMRSVLEFYEKEKASIPPEEEDQDFAYLELLIESSPSYNYVKKIRINEDTFLALMTLTTSQSSNRYSAAGKPIAKRSIAKTQIKFDLKTPKSFSTLSSEGFTLIK